MFGLREPNAQEVPLLLPVFEGYTKQHCLMLVWDIEDLESVGLPHNDADIRIFSVNYYLPVRGLLKMGKLLEKELYRLRKA